MIFVINKLKYDTDKMELVSDKCKYTYCYYSFSIYYYAKDVKLWKSKKDNWLLTYKTDIENCGKALSREEAQKLLIDYDLDTYERIFGKLEEA